MKKLLLSVFTLFFVPVLSFSQHAYAPEFASGNMKYIDLANPASYTVIGVGPNQLGASDFAADGFLYGISGSNNGLYRIDTTNASSTLIGTVAPPGSEFWTGMALDPTDGTLYIASTDGNTSSFFTLNVTNATATLVGTNTADDGVVGIAFDDNGQMYAIYLVRKFYKINKANGAPTLVGSLTTACTAGQWHGLDFCHQNQTMYMTSYNAFTFDSQLWTINLSNGTNTLVGSVGTWTGSIATSNVNASVLNADFTASTTTGCEGDVISFTDQSTGSPTTWLWTFEGGSPGTSTQQNPVVTYNSSGVYDVTLEISNGAGTNTEVKQNYITVNATPVPVISGANTTCAGTSEDYSTADNTGSTYQWEVTGGTITNGAGTHEVTVKWETVGNGDVKVTELQANCSATTMPYLVAVDDCTGFGEAGPAGIEVYPNPADKILNIIYPDASLRGYRVTINDLLGQEVAGEFVSRNEDDGTCQADISSLSEGIYILRVEVNQGNVVSMKFIKR